jgi:fatty acid desaturase
VNPQPALADSQGPLPADMRRRQVLARRRLALVILMVLAVGTLVGAVITGRYLLLALTLAIDVMLAVYIAVLLQITRHQAETRLPVPPGRVGAASY